MLDQAIEERAPELGARSSHVEMELLPMPRRSQEDDGASRPLINFAVGAWVEDALCRGMEDLFFSPLGPDWTLAKKVCSDCPVRRTCLEYALETEQLHGTWGGNNQLELRFLLALDPFERPKRYSGVLKCPWCRKGDISLASPPARSGKPEVCTCADCGFEWTRVYVPRKGRRKVA